MVARFLLLAAIAPALAAFAAEPALIPENTTPIELAPRAKTVRVLLKYSGTPAPATLNNPIPVVGVYLGGLAKDASNFSAVWTHKVDPFTIDLTVDPLQMQLAGNYDVFLELQPDTARLKITLTHPMPKLQAISKLLIDRTYWFFGQSYGPKPKLSLHESSNKSKLTLSGIKPSGNTVLNTLPIGGTLNLKAEGKEIPPGGDLDVDYDIANDFGVGTATGTMRVDAQELTDPAGTFDFEVRGHAHPAYIGITIALGLLLSYLLKVYLAQRIELEQARADARKLLEQVRQEESRHADETFRNSYQLQLQALTKALAGADPRAINDAKTALDQQWRSQLQALQQRHQQQLDELNKLLDVVNYDWPVPSAVMEPVVCARESHANVRAAIDRDDLRDASDQLRQILINLGQGVAEKGAGWQKTAAEALKTLSSPEHGISPAVQSGFAKPAQDAASALSKLDATATLDTAAKIQDALGSIRVERSSLIPVLDYLKMALEKEWAEAKTAVIAQEPPQWDKAAFQRLGEAIQAFTSFLQTIPDRPDVGETATQLGMMHQAWTAALEKQLPGPNPEVTAALAANKYLEGVKAVVQARKRAAQDGQEAAVDVRMPPFTVPAYSPGTPAAPLPLHSVRTSFQTLFTPPPSLPTAVSDERELKRDKRIQSLVVGVVLIVAGYGLQLNTFVGTFTDFSTLFFWAFGLDLTVDAISKAAKRS
jgi:hypothetical protein